jgi:hypothetical protein
MSYSPVPGFIAGGTLAPYTAVKLSTSADGTVVVGAAGTDPVIGIVQGAIKTFPGIVGSDDAISAIAGDQVKVAMTPGEVAYALAGTGGSTRGAEMECDANGALVVAAGSGEHFIIGDAMTAVSAGVVFKLLIRPRWKHI